MWVSQTYLGNPDPDAKAFIYYLWEDYKSQKDVPPAVIDKLAELGRSFSSDVSAFAPLQGSHHEIRSELRSQGFDFFWSDIGPNTPGLFLTDVPLSKFDPHENEWLFFHLGKKVTEDETALVEVFKTIRSECQKLVEGHSGEQSGFWGSLYDSAQLKLTFMGLGIDFKPIISRTRRRR